MTDSKKPVKYREIFDSDQILSNADLLLTTAVSRVLGTRGYCLDLAGVEIDFSIHKMSNLEFFYNAIYEGYILTGIQEVPKITTHYHSIKLEVFTKNDLIFGNESDEIYWTLQSLRERLQGTPYIENVYIRNTSNTVLYTVATHIVRRVLGETNSKLIIEFDKNQSQSGEYYVNLLTCRQVHTVLADYYEINVEIPDQEFDFLMYLHTSKSLGRNKNFTKQEKMDIAKQEGIVEGGIYVLWTRGSMTSNTPEGFIKSRKLIRIDSYKDIENGGNTLRYSVIPEPFTIEERLYEYADIHDDYKLDYQDLLSGDMNTYSQTSNIYNVAFGNYIYDEEEFILPIMDDEYIEKPVSVVDDVEGHVMTSVEMSAPDAVYWSLKQHDVPFNEEIYRSLYFTEGIEPLYNRLSFDVLGSDAQ